jgi:hypothetical protein
LGLCRADSSSLLLKCFYDIRVGEERFAPEGPKRDLFHLFCEVCMTFAYVAPILLLCCSNVFMTFAWYGQLRFPTAPLLWVIPISWGIAFLEYCFAVPANRIGHQVYSAAQLKTMQEVITLVVFAIFSVSYLGEPLKWNHGVAFGLIVAAAYFAFHKF